MYPMRQKVALLSDFTEGGGGALLVTRVQSVFEPVRHAALRERGQWPERRRRRPMHQSMLMMLDRIRKKRAREYLENTGWPLRLWQTSRWLQNKSSVLVWGPCTKTQLLFWSQREVCHNLSCRPVYGWKKALCSGVNSEINAVNLVSPAYSLSTQFDSTKHFTSFKEIAKSNDH